MKKPERLYAKCERLGNSLMCDEWITYTFCAKERSSKSTGAAEELKADEICMKCPHRKERR